TAYAIETSLEFRRVLFRSRIDRASTTATRPSSTSPIPVMSLIASVAMIDPAIPHSDPITPASAQDGTVPGSGGLGNRSRNSTGRSEERRVGTEGRRDGRAE